MVLGPQQPGEQRPVPKWLEELCCPQVPYFKNVSLTMLKPQQFGLDQWERYFTIPDKWMRKIYKDEVYFDTDLPRKEDPETLTREQKNIIYDWLTHESPFRYQQPKKPTPGRGRRSYGPSTDLVDILDAARDSDLDSEDLESDGSDSDIHNLNRIPILIGHMYQPEHMIVKKAIQNMRQLPDDQKDQIKRLMADPELMKFMHEKVSLHLGKSSDGYAI